LRTCINAPSSSSGLSPRPFAYLRAAPRSILFPTDAQIEARLKFSEAAKQARGLKGLCPCHGLPWAAHFVKVGASGFRSEEAEERRPKLLEQRMMGLQQLALGSLGSLWGLVLGNDLYIARSVILAESMTLLRPQTINLMADKRPLSRRELGLYGLQLVRLGGMAKWVFKKPMILRNPPYTVGPYAHDGQLEVRLKFAEVAHGAKGQQGRCIC
jgi:hypothetical protein